MPSGRDVIQLQTINLPTLDQETIAQLRAPLDEAELARVRREISEDSDTEEQTEIPGSFLDSQEQSSSYY